MTIAEVRFKIKLILRDFREWLEGPSVYFSLVLVLLALVSFGLGRLSLLEEKREPVRITGGLPAAKESIAGATAAPRPSVDETAAAVLSGGGVAASKNGTKYYFPWCGGLSRIKKENLISFVSATEAEAAGYGIAANCAPRDTQAGTPR